LARNPRYDRAFIKGQRYTLLAHRENLTLDGQRALKKLLKASKRLSTAYVLKESFWQLWDYRSERGARAFFERWQDGLKWQRLEPYKKFAQMIEKHWDGIASYCHPDNGRGDRQFCPGNGHAVIGYRGKVTGHPRP
jgi:transposase